MIRQNNEVFELNTDNTTYVFGVTSTGHLEHYYYGRRISNASMYKAALSRKTTFAPGNTCIYNPDTTIALDNMNLELSTLGKGDYREPMLMARMANGSATLDFVYESFEISKGKADYKTLPGSYGTETEVETLKIVLCDAGNSLKLEMLYHVYTDCDVITRSVKLYNASENALVISRIMSAQVDFEQSGLVMTTFNGVWAREMNKSQTKLVSGTHINQSLTGTSSNNANPFVMLSDENTDEDNGLCYGFNLIYSGNHCEMASVGAAGGTRLLVGINPTGFEYKLDAGECFEAPEAVMSVSRQGFNGLSHNMHSFVNNHIVRGKWKNKPRPVLLNSWEAAYFDIDEGKLYSLAKEGSKLGIELFVIDDGWFGNRNDDKSCLGDWTVNKKKFPSGIDGFVGKLEKLGLSTGIWVEPEMVNVDSELYAKHPDWTLEVPGNAHSEGRNQRILDLSKTEVQNYIIEAMSDVFSKGVSYVKWDMNRNFTDIFSQGAAPEEQGGVLHRYYIGLYRIMKQLTEQFPDILFEGCSAGGNRFDLGILCYFQQIWASDNSDAVERSRIQTSYSYGYPQSVISAHVSQCPNHQTLRVTPLETRFNVAAFGVLGYECDFRDMNSVEKEKIKQQIEEYKQHRELLNFGTLYRGRCEGNVVEWTCVSKDRKNAIGMLMHILTIPNQPNEMYYAKGLDETEEYHLYNNLVKYNIKEFGSLVNTVAPIHIKQDGVLHNTLARFVKMDGEVEDVTATGDLIMYAGVRLKQNFAATGYNNEVRYYPDYASRMYYITSTALGAN